MAPAGAIKLLLIDSDTKQYRSFITVSNRPLKGRMTTQASKYSVCLEYILY